MTPFSLLRCLGAQQGYTRGQNLQHTQELCPAGLSTGSNAYAGILKKRKLFSWARGMQKCLEQRLTVDTYKFLFYPWGYDPLNSFFVIRVRSLPWHIPVCPWKGGVCWGQSWGWCEQQSRRDEKYLRVVTVSWKFSGKGFLSPGHNLWSPPCAKAATSTEPGWGNTGVPVLLGKAGKTKSNITIR